MTEIEAGGQTALTSVASTLVSDPMRCFIVGPIGNKFAEFGSPARETYEDALEVFEKVIVPACQAFSIEPVRADQIAVSGAVTEQVLRHLFEDEIVIADVTGGNPNVMYELGLRHTRNLATILIGEFGQLPFDIADLRTLQFSKSDRGLIDARKGLEKMLSAALTEPPEQIAATRIWNAGGRIGGPSTELVGEGTGVSDASVSEEDLDPAGLVDQMASIEDRFPIVTEISEKISAIIEDMGTLATDSAGEIDAATSQSPSAKTRLTMIAKFANALQKPADELSTQTNNFYAEMSELNGDMIGLLSYLESRSPEENADDDVSEFLNTVTDLSRSAREAMEHTGAFATVMDGLGAISRTLRRPARQISEAVRVMIGTVKFTDEWENRSVKIRKTLAAAKPPS